MEQKGLHFTSEFESLRWMSETDPKKYVALITTYIRAMTAKLKRL